MLTGDKLRELILSLAMLLVFAAQTHAEYTRVELQIFGMDCATCAHGVRIQIQKVDGVESVELSLQRASADIRLRQNNRVTLDQFRKIVKGNGFQPRQASVAAVGTVREIGGKLAFEVSGLTTPLVVAPDRTEPGAYKELQSAFDSKTSAVFEITGTVEQRRDGVELIAIGAVKRRR
jgi:copper chaperone CopZ